MAVNVVLPWFWARADAGGDAAARQYVESLYINWSPGEDNTVLKLARARLFNGEKPALKNTASLQQGLLQIVRDFCGYSNALCDQCPLPGLLESVNAVGDHLRAGAQIDHHEVHEGHEG